MTSLLAGVRSIRQSPGFSLVAIVTLAVGIAANAVSSRFDQLSLMI